MSNKDLERAITGFDDAFKEKLTAAIITAIADASRIDGCLVIRTGESAAALTTVLASVLALSPSSVRSPAAIRQATESIRRKLTAQVRCAETDPSFADFKARCFRDDDRERGGRA
jgi:hypothetical protein